MDARDAAGIGAAIERLLSKRQIDSLSGCWEWQGRRDRWGYGRITIAHRRRSVHRVAASLFLDFDLESPLHILHRCDNPPCFNPDHLYAGTNVDNVRDRMTRPRAQDRGSVV
jgi:HNH endonuclease